MCSDVLLEVVLAAKTFVAKRAWEGPRPAVDAAVAGQLFVAGETFVASLVTADEGPLTRVDPKVALELALVAESGAALSTTKPLRPRPPGTHPLHLRRRHQHVKERHQGTGPRKAAEGSAQAHESREDGIGGQTMGVSQQARRRSLRLAAFRCCPWHVLLFGSCHLVGPFARGRCGLLLEAPCTISGWRGSNVAVSRGGGRSFW